MIVSETIDLFDTLLKDPNFPHNFRSDDQAIVVDYIDKLENAYANHAKPGSILTNDEKGLLEGLKEYIMKLSGKLQEIPVPEKPPPNANQLVKSRYLIDFYFALIRYL